MALFNAIVNITKRFPSIGGWALLLLLLEGISTFIVQDSLLFPHVTSIALRAATLLFSAGFLTHATSTLGETMASTFLALVIGVPLGIVVGRSEFVRAVAESPIDWLRSIPATALFPVFLLILGIGSNTRIAIATYAATFAVLIPIMYGVASVDKDRIRHMQRAGMSRIQIYRHVLFWEALPSLLTGIRLGISAALVLVVVGEMFIGSSRGLGFLAIDFQQSYETTSMYASIVLIGLLGYGLNRLVRFAEGALH